MKSKIFLFTLTLIYSTLGLSQVNIQHPVSSGESNTIVCLDPSAYVWQEESSLQGINIYMPPATSPIKPEIYMQQSKARFAFNTVYSGALFIELQLNFDNTGYQTVYIGSSIQEYSWVIPPTYFTTPGWHNLKVKYRPFNGIMQEREYDVKVVPDCFKFYTDHLTTNYFYTNKLTLWEDLSNTNPKKPILMVEGYDAYNLTNAEFFIDRASSLFNALFGEDYKIYVLTLH